MIGEACVLINRTSTPLEVVKDGVTKVLKPGKNNATTDWIRFAKMQHPRMGTFDASGLSGEYLVAVEGSDDDGSMLPPGSERKNGAVEKFDRSDSSFEGDAATAVPMASGVAMPMARVPNEMSPLPKDTTFSGRD